MGKVRRKFECLSEVMLVICDRHLWFMSKITSELLAKLAPGTKPDSLRDRFLPYLNEACPRYEIDTELRVGAFLPTICFESNYFRATREGRARAGSKVRAVQDKYWGTGFFGRGLIQTTHRKNYVLFSQAMFKAGLIDTEFLFVEQPELLEQPRWAVESACYFWQSNNLNSYADKGKFFAIQGLTNRGNASKEAWGYADREKLYLTALRYMPDNFNLQVSVASPTSLESETSESNATTATPDPLTTATTEPPTPEGTPEVIAGATQSAVSTETTTTETTGTPPGDTTQTTTTTSEAAPVAVTPAKPTLQATAIAFFTMIYGYYKMAKEDFGNLVDRATDAIDLHMAINLAVGAGLVVLGIWLHQRSRQRAAEITQSLIKTAADQQSNTVTLVSKSHWWNRFF